MKTFKLIVKTANVITDMNFDVLIPKIRSNKNNVDIEFDGTTLKYNKVQLDVFIEAETLEDAQAKAKLKTAFFSGVCTYTSSLHEVVEVSDEIKEKLNPTIEKPTLSVADAGNYLYEMDMSGLDSIELREGFGQSFVYSREEVVAVIDSVK